jgi:CubicO group peptidase (beta-lactamase class C family)
MAQREEGRIKDVLTKGAREGVFPGAALLVARAGEVCARHEEGQRVLDPEPAPVERNTVFDLASLTKPLATTLAMMRLVDEGKIGLDQPLGEILPQAPLKDKEAITPRLLLSHSAGLVDWKPYYFKLVNHEAEERKTVLRKWIIDEPFAYEPGNGSLYSDLGFVLLEWVIDEVSGERLPDYLEKNFYDPLGLERLFFIENSPRSPFIKGGSAEGEALDRGGRVGVEEFAVTEDCPWRKRVIRGEVGDENAFAVGGYSGHAGLFGTVDDVCSIVNMLREHYRGERNDFFRPETVQEFFRRQDLVTGSTWALGWDTPSKEGSSAGKYFSENSVGHLGFTGTSVWMDLDKDVIVILLTNRIQPTRNNERIKTFRPRLHDTVMEELGLAELQY